jgi:hypothetical protein
MGGAERAGGRPWIPLLAAAKLAYDGAGAAWLTAEQNTKHRALCFYCLLASAATWGALAHTVPEARSALRSLRE